MNVARFAGLASVLLLAGTAVAHDLYIVPGQFRATVGQPVTIGYHSGDGFPESTQNPARLQNATLYSADGKVSLEPRADAPPAAAGAAPVAAKRSIATATVPKSGHYITTIVAGTRTFSMKADEFLDYLKEEGLTHVIEARTKSGEANKDASERYTKYAKSIFLAGAPNDFFKKVIGLPIEIVPEKDPYALKPGESLPVRVLVRGTPAAGLEIRTASSGTEGPQLVSSGKTGADGRISIPVAPGPYRLHALHMERVTDGSADWESLWATLTFEVR
jgi:uncharacterized GH25 family protein